MKDHSHYDPKFVRSLFDEMAGTYGIVNLFSSFGFTFIWRRQCARSISIDPRSVVLDLMAGMGELGTEVAKHLEENGELIALDISPVMCQCARKHEFKNGYHVLEADALASPIADSTIDRVFSTFGLKTFNQSQLASLASEVSRILKPGGQFAFLEVSVPPNPVLRVPYMFYLNRMVPVLGRLFLGNPDNYRMLGIYTTEFGDCDDTAMQFQQSGLEVELQSYFFGCATGFTGRKPVD